MAQYFRLEQAQLLIPKVEQAIRDALFLKQELIEAEQTLRKLQERVHLAGGISIDRQAVIDLRARRETNAQRLQVAIEHIHSFGCQVKDLDIGLIDFPSLYKGQEVCLCWKLGETAIEWWHGAEEGFRGRKRIDEEFIAEHKGGSH